MKKITWIRLSSKRRYGGTIYGEKVRKILSSHYQLETVDMSSGFFGWRYSKPLRWFLNSIKLKGKSDLWIRDDFFSIALQPLSKTQGKNLAIVHHINSSVFPLLLRTFLFFLEKLFYFNLKKNDAILTISQYWQDHFLERGYRNVFKIYNSFDLNEFNVSEKEVVNFKKRYHLEGKPIIYIGNCQRVKGVVESYQALKDLDVHLVTSGRQQVKIPARNLEIEYGDYLKLLKASSVVITMSKFKEGWCRTAHEAMLLKTPVIGSGKGGMGELLEGGKQIICENFGLLKEKVEYLLNNLEKRKEIGEKGYNFAKNFTLERFKKDWLELMNNILKQ